MCSIHSVKEIDDVKFVSLMNDALNEMQSAGLPHAVLHEYLIAALAFKYWHENCSAQVNTIIEAKDVDYVRLHWNSFRQSITGVALYGQELKIDVDYTYITKLIGKFSCYITHRHFDVDNVKIIVHLKRLIGTPCDKGFNVKLENLKRIYERRTRG